MGGSSVTSSSMWSASRPSAASFAFASPSSPSATLSRIVGGRSGAAFESATKRSSSSMTPTPDAPSCSYEMSLNVVPSYEQDVFHAGGVPYKRDFGASDAMVAIGQHSTIFAYS